MKKTNYFKLIAFALICCLSSTMSAQTNADSITFASTFTSMQTSGGGIINLTTDIPIHLIKNQTVALESNALNPIQITTNQFKIISVGDGTSADSCFLRVGNNVSISGTNIVLSDYRRGHIRIVGGSVISNTTTPGAAAIYANDGWVYINGGTVSVNASGLTTGTYAFAINTVNYMSLCITGGNISATGDYTRAVTASDFGNGFLRPISGATISASGSGVYGLEVLGVSATPMTIGNNLTINTTSSDGTDVGIVNSGTTSILIIPGSISNLNITATTNYKQVNASAVLYDLRGVSITTNPASGSTISYPNNVTLTSTGNPTVASAGIYYSYSGNPAITNSNVQSGSSVAATSSPTTIKASIGKLGFIDSNVYTFTYTVTNLPSNTPNPISSFAGLKAAYLVSQTATIDTTRLKLMANITDSITAFTLTPDATHPMTIDANGFQINIGYNATSTFTITIGGNLIIKSNTAPTDGLFRIYGLTTTNITGGSYILNASKPIFYENTGSSISDVATQLNLSNANFVVNGTTNVANIIKTNTSNGYLFSATNCNFTTSAKSVAFSFNGTKSITLKNCTLDILGNDVTTQAFYQGPTSTASGYVSNLIIDGLTLNMNAGNVFNWIALANVKSPINTIIKDLNLTGSATIAKPTGLYTTCKFYDFRAFTPTASVTPGNYGSAQSVGLSLVNTAIPSVDAGAATFVYTIDGTDPILSSLTATPVAVSTPTTIKMAAKSADGLFLGKIYSFPYTFTATGIANVDGNNGISIYPTIVEKVVTMNRMASHIQVLDLSGKLMMQRSNVSQFDMSAIKPGVYLVRIETADATSKTIKVVKL